MTNILYFKPIVWISASIVGFFSFIMNCVIFKKEWKKRKSKEIKFTNKYLQIFSLSTIISGVFYGFFSTVASINRFCHFGYQMLSVSAVFQCLFMGFYQLSRLYYCFASTQIHSNKGYPNWLFIIMHIIGILGLILSIISVWGSSFWS